MRYILKVSGRKMVNEIKNGRTNGHHYVWCGINCNRSIEIGFTFMAYLLLTLETRKRLHFRMSDGNIREKELFDAAAGAAALKS